MTDTTQPTADEHRVRLPSTAALRREAADRRRAANDVVWRYADTEADDRSTPKDITVQRLQEALDELGWTPEDLAERVARVRRVRAEFRELDEVRPVAISGAQRRAMELLRQAADLKTQAEQLEREGRMLSMQQGYVADCQQSQRSAALQNRALLLEDGMPPSMVPIPELKTEPRVKARAQHAVYVDDALRKAGETFEVREAAIDGKHIVKPEDYVEPTPSSGAIAACGDIDAMSPEQVAALEALAAANAQTGPEHDVQLRHPAIELVNALSTQDPHERADNLRAVLATSGLDHDHPSLRHAKRQLDALEKQLAAEAEAGDQAQPDDGRIEDSGVLDETGNAS